MGRKRTEETEERPGKATPTKLDPIDQKTHPEPWNIMEMLIREVPIFTELADASIRMFWATDWEPDIDGVVTGAKCAKASERERNLAEFNGSTVDLIVMLPHNVWPTLDDIEKEHRIYHELRHFRQAKNQKTGQQKFDEKGRSQWRTAKHEIVAFLDEVERYGVERILHRNSAMARALAYVDRPMEKVFDQAADAYGDDQPAAEAPSGNGKPSRTDWREMGLCAAAFSDTEERLLEDAGITSLGQLKDRVDLKTPIPGVNGNYRKRIEGKLRKYLEEIGATA